MTMPLSTDAAQAAEGASFQAFLDEFATAFVRVSGLEVDSEIEVWLKRVAEFLDGDRCTLAELRPEGLIVTHAWAGPGYEPARRGQHSSLPWLAAKIRRGELFAFSDRDDIPQDAVAERAIAERMQMKAHASLPLVISATVIGSLHIACMRHSRQWPEALIQRLRLIATVFGNALARRNAFHDRLQLGRALEHAGRVAAIGELASSFAHEINQPLAASLTNARTALRLLEAPQSDLGEVRAALEDIAADNLRAGDIVRELRRFLRRQEPSLVRVEVQELLQAVVRFVSPEARNQGVEVRLDVAEAVPDVLADQVQVQQVLVNLLLNAFDALAASAPGHRRVLLASAPAPSNRIAISVTDSGPGVPADVRPRLFESFFSTKPHGLGIGLAIAQTIVAAHGSRIEYSDAPGGGAVFAFSLESAADGARGC
jgi:C4-dicarboxylate-specific signal transduction histidine kinase